MPDKFQKVLDTTKEIVDLGQHILSLVPGEETLATAIGAIERIALKAVQAWHDSKDLAITPESVNALLVKTDPLVWGSKK